MTFQEILPEFLKGAKIRKTSWTKQYVFINNKNVIVDENNNVCHLQGHNLVEDGWEIYDDREYFDFWKAFELMKEGKKVRRKNWKSNSEYLFLPEYLFLKPDGRFFGKYNEDYYAYTIHQEDLDAVDWYIVEGEQ